VPINKKIAIIPIIVIVVIVVVNFSSDEPNKKNNVLFHITLADPNLYTNGIYTETFFLEKGEYSFRFVPNGSSPKILSITLNGDTLNFFTDFHLVGTSQKTEISEYYTWEYDGQNNIIIFEMQEISIIINPNGETLGSVSIDILEN